MRAEGQGLEGRFPFAMDKIEHIDSRDKNKRRHGGRGEGCIVQRSAELQC